MTTVAGWATELAWMAAQMSLSGVHVQVAACCKVSLGGSLESATQSGSMAPSFMCSPLESAWMGRALPAKVTSMLHEVPAASRHRKVGGVMPGGKMEPFSG